MEARTIAFHNGCLTCRVRGEQAVLAMEFRPDRPGLYRGLLRGPKGQRDLGLLLPEGGCLRLCRSVPVRELERAGCWPVTGADAVLRHAFADGGGSTLPQGWKKAGDVSARFQNDPVLFHAAGETTGVGGPGASRGFLLPCRPMGAGETPAPGPGVLLCPDLRHVRAAMGNVLLFPGGKPVMPEIEE